MDVSDLEQKLYEHLYSEFRDRCICKELQTEIKTSVISFMARHNVNYNVNINYNTKNFKVTLS